MKITLVGVALATALLATAATAEPGDKRRDVRVTIADLDLATPDGVAALDRRLAKAVLKACGTAFYLDPSQLNDVDRCRTDAGARATNLRQQVLKGGETRVALGSKSQ